jgi:hypothetical protein
MERRTNDVFSNSFRVQGSVGELSDRENRSILSRRESHDMAVRNLGDRERRGGVLCELLFSRAWRKCAECM